MAYAFRCRNCNSLESADAAGERRVPIKCPTCGAGVSWSPDGVRTEDPDNWIVLAELSDKELKPILEYHAIDAAEIEAHTPLKAADPDHVPVSIAVEATSASDGTPSNGKGA